MVFTKIICPNDCLTRHFRIFSKGLSEYPLLRFWQIKGLAVGLVRRYPCDYCPSLSATAIINPAQNSVEHNKPN